MKTAKKITPQRTYVLRHKNKGLCPVCPSKVAVKQIKQDGRVVFQKSLAFCYKHHLYRLEARRNKA